MNNLPCTYLANLWGTYCLNFMILRFCHDKIVTCSRDGSAIIWRPISRRSHVSSFEIVSHYGFQCVVWRRHIINVSISMNLRRIICTFCSPMFELLSLKLMNFMERFFNCLFFLLPQGKSVRWTMSYHLKVPPPPLPPQPLRGGPRQRILPTPRGVNMIVWSLDKRFVLAAVMGKFYCCSMDWPLAFVKAPLFVYCFFVFCYALLLYAMKS